MSDSSGPGKTWWGTLPGILAGAAGLVTALTSAVMAWQNMQDKRQEQQVAAEAVLAASAPGAGDVAQEGAQQGGQDGAQAGAGAQEASADANAGSTAEVKPQQTTTAEGEDVCAPSRGDQRPIACFK